MDEGRRDQENLWPRISYQIRPIKPKQPNKFFLPNFSPSLISKKYLWKGFFEYALRNQEFWSHTLACGVHWSNGKLTMPIIGHGFSCHSYLLFFFFFVIFYYVRTLLMIEILLFKFQTNGCGLILGYLEF